jgi:hypothetical protein
MCKVLFIGVYEGFDACPHRIVGSKAKPFGQPWGFRRAFNFLDTTQISKLECQFSGRSAERGLLCTARCFRSLTIFHPILAVQFNLCLIALLRLRSVPTLSRV